MAPPSSLTFAFEVREPQMHVFVTGGAGHSGPYIIFDLIAAGHEVTALARPEKCARLSVYPMP
jgi:NAD(P)-dependent dehydrogenase (short-subunit alcohol dehydrogenase family)